MSLGRIKLRLSKFDLSASQAPIRKGLLTLDATLNLGRLQADLAIQDVSMFPQ